ncbi:MAG: KpsF/GutQ family sugar-phosphate isomerase [Tidjanibacter sp.]|nr:KpsF/GutQ family sugar-phosphate isomerase [Tidjanibacter sp.]MBR6831280.1 KpsF/GutQ family sugar-phosphate isomerase [Tidjanibacter sp.]
MSKIKQYALDTIKAEAEAVENLLNLVTDDFEGAVKEILACKGKVVVTGVGKSGIIGKKIAATLASTGTLAMFVHPAEAYHGDLGMIAPEDVVIAIANSGQTDEILRLIPFFERRGNVIIAMTGNPESPLAQHAKYIINIATRREACPLNLAPTSSTTTTLVMGDALATALMQERNFKSEDYALFHPGGSLGRRLLTTVGDVMRTDNIPCITRQTSLGDAIMTISQARFGIAPIVEDGKLIGVITDGDIRRAMTKYKDKFLTTPAEAIMTTTPKTITADKRIVEAERIMRVNKIHSLVVVDSEKQVTGIVEYFNVSVLV